MILYLYTKVFKKNMIENIKIRIELTKYNFKITIIINIITLFYSITYAEYLIYNNTLN